MFIASQFERVMTTAQTTKLWEVFDSNNTYGKKLKSKKSNPTTSKG